MGVIDRLQESWYRATGRTVLAEQVREQRAELHAERETNLLLQESLQDLENRMYDPGWQRFTALAEQEFSRDGLRQITAVCRVMCLKNPLIKRGLAVRSAYVWGQGVEISARDAARKGGRQDVNTVIQEFLDDPGNQRAFSGQQAREENERALGTDGNLFFALFTSPKTGRVKVRNLPWDEITDVICNPEDASEPWLYKREWWAEYRDPMSGGVIQKRRFAFYPALGHRPARRPTKMADVGGGLVDVLWDAPVYHVRVGGLKGWKFGVPDCYAAVDWANGYREFLTDWAKLIKALSRFAWRLTSKGSKQAAAKSKLAARPTVDSASGEERFAGATALLTQDMLLEAIPKSGATIDSESGRPLAAMVAAALDIPVTMLLGDPGVTGARATAETLDRPTEQMAESRRSVWTQAISAILAYVIAESVRAPEGTLRGTITYDGDRETVTLRGKAQGTVDISWPAVEQTDLDVLIDAITKADQTTYLPPPIVTRLLLEALGVTDVDEILKTLTDEQGRWLPPDAAGGGAGQAVVDAFRRGDEDPTRMLTGPGDDEPPEDVPPGEGRNSRGKTCGAVLDAGGMCKRAAGWGTGHVGLGRCRDHDGMPDKADDDDDGFSQD